MSTPLEVPRANDLPSVSAATKRAEDIEIACWRSLLEAPPARVQAALGVRVFANRWGSALVCAGADHVLMNRVFLHVPQADATRDDLDELLDAHRAAGVTRFFVHVGVDEEPALRPHLEAKGLARYQRNWVKLRRPLATSEQSVPPSANPAGFEPLLANAPSGVRLRKLEAGDSESFADLFRVGFGMPEKLRTVMSGAIGLHGFHAFGAFVGGELAAVGLLFHRRGTDYLAGGPTAPSHRRKGLQGLLVETRLHRATALGCVELVSETGEEKPGEEQHSFRNMLRHGLRPIRVRHNWAPPGCAW